MTAQAEPTLIHFMTTMAVYISSTRAEVMTRASELLVTAEVREASIDRNGESWLDLLDKPDAQVARYGRVVFARGPFPSGEVRTEPGTVEHTDVAWQAHREAEKLANAVERRKALDAVGERFGEDTLRTSQTIAKYAGSQ